jgi:hypothetical protein
MDLFKKKETPKEAATRAKRETKREVKVRLTRNHHGGYIVNDNTPLTLFCPFRLLLYQFCLFLFVSLL